MVIQSGQCFLGFKSFSSGQPEAFSILPLSVLFSHKELSSGQWLRKLEWKQRLGLCPDWGGSVGWASPRKLKCHQFDSPSGHVTGLQARPPVGGMQEATDAKGTRLTFFFFSFPSAPSKNKYIKSLKTKQTKKPWDQIYLGQYAQSPVSEDACKVNRVLLPHGHMLALSYSMGWGGVSG